MTPQSQQTIPKHLLPTTSIKLKQRRWRQAWYYDKERESLREMWHHDIKAYLAAFRLEDSDHDQILEEGMAAFAKLLTKLLERAAHRTYSDRGQQAGSSLTHSMTSIGVPPPEVVFLAIDFEGEVHIRGITEFGLARLDPQNLQSGIQCMDFALSSKRSRGKFLFGEYVRIDSFQLPNVIRDELTDDKRRKIVLVGHSISSELRTMRVLGVPIEAFENVVGTIDTCLLSRDSQRKGFSLQGLLDHLQIGYEDNTFHCAGNDACYTMQAFLALMVRRADEVTRITGSGGAACGGPETTMYERIKELAWKKALLKREVRSRMDVEEHRADGREDEYGVFGGLFEDG
ncbi:unnamed protein product [Zymoseptoria tritici ST99CH_1E4]|uniref:Gfd2/YDR514C-like C-terminal domain-containing protein n=1 Tax=Zymoseptoria tritici ST99CH_1E4 TaxID=1276532 RepID=A0A2H1GCD1_ZYMTR|nr:unnamed protein product [Zymoseptoria tritici ST99CH_1E4]